MTDFIEAASVSEARERIFALVGEEPATSRGPKRALVALARALRLDVELEATNGRLGAQLAATLNRSWGPPDQTETGQITLRGLNTILEAAASRSAKLSDAHRRHERTPLTGREWGWFRPARSKIEAVNRISLLTDSGPEELGPGAKERKSVLSNLATHAFPDIDTGLSKTELGSVLADRLGVTWDDSCASTGYTITLRGLNVVLAGAERYISDHGDGIEISAEREASALLGVISSALTYDIWDGRDCVAQMREDEYSQWRQLEWPGFFFEYAALPALTAAFGMPEGENAARNYGNTNFDYQWNRVWDLKVHTSSKKVDEAPEKRAPTTAILNDAEAIRECVSQRGLGFIVLDGVALYDPSFDDWHRGFVAKTPGKTGASNTGIHRRR